MVEYLGFVEPQRTRCFAAALVVAVLVVVAVAPFVVLAVHTLLVQAAGPVGVAFGLAAAASALVVAAHIPVVGCLAQNLAWSFHLQ